jgi:acyl transferase domain-containing protein
MVYVSNVKARVLRTAVEVASDLANKIAHGVRWYDATTVLQELGCNLFVEMPPGHVLTNLAKRAIPRLDALPWQRILSLILCDKRNSSDERAYHPGWNRAEGCSRSNETAIHRQMPVRQSSQYQGKDPMVRLKLVCKVEYGELTADDQLRHTNFLGWRDDKKAEEVVLEHWRRIAMITEIHVFL